MILAAGTSEYGSLNGLVEAASALVSVVLTLVGLWWKRPMLADVPDALVKAGEVVLTAVGIALLWTQFSEFSAGRTLIQIVIRLAAGFAVSLLIVVALGIVCGLKRNVGTGSETTEVGGFWLTEIGRKAVETQGSKQDGYAACLYDPSQMWPLPSRLLAQGVFLVFDWAVAFTGSMGIAGAAILLMMYEVPRIVEFSVAPTSVEVNGAAMVHWGVSDNASKVELDPFGQVATSGDRPLTITKDETFRLTATNAFGTRSIEQGVMVHPPAEPKPAPKPDKNKGKKSAVPPVISPDIVVEGRTCGLIEHVVIRGSGWLETDDESNSGSESRADCAAAFPAAGQYEMFVTYAAQDSRPVRVTLNQKILQENALAAVTGGWAESNELELSLGVVQVNAGANILEFFSRQPFPHIQRIRFRRSS
ncbi:MAG: hypothetical protein ABR923_02575 [Terracidiphilus sp.]|jgi:hypothetical protein